MEEDNNSVITHLTNDTHKQFGNVNNFVVNNEPVTENIPFGPQEISLADYSKTQNKSLTKEYKDDDEKEITPLALEQFKFTVKRWLELDDQIKALGRQAKELRKIKNELQPQIQTFMDDYDIDDLNTQNSKLKLLHTKRKQGFSQKLMIKKLGDYYQNEEQAQKIIEFVLSHREEKEVISLRRYRSKS